MSIYTKQVTLPNLDSVTRFVSQDPLRFVKHATLALHAEEVLVLEWWTGHSKPIRQRLSRTLRYIYIQLPHPQSNYPRRLK